MGDITPLQSPAGGLQLRPPEAIKSAHDLSTFQCGNDKLDEWLKRRAVASDGKTSRAYVVPIGMRVVGYYCVAAGSVGRNELPTRIRRNTPDQVPVIILGRLATDKRFQGRGIGKGMLREAISRTISASETIGVRALLVHAIDAEAAAFYLHFKFSPCPIGDRTFLLAVETAKQALV